QGRGRPRNKSRQKAILLQASDGRPHPPLAARGGAFAPSGGALSHRAGAGDGRGRGDRSLWRHRRGAFRQCHPLRAADRVQGKRGGLVAVRSGSGPLGAPFPRAPGSAALVVRVSPESGGHGVVEVIEAVHKPGAPIKGRVAVWKSLAAGLVIGSGGSAGREGPVVHLGGAVASSLSRFLALPRSETSML